MRTITHLLPTKTVYSLYYPEVREIISELARDFPHSVFLQSITPGLDDYHQATISAYIEHFRPYLNDLEQFSYRYISAGASEAIFHILSEISSFANKTPLYQLAGEYEGYSAYAANLNLKFKTVDINFNFESLKPGIFFISNPSARDGNYLPDGLIDELCAAGHRIVLDLTYFGAAFPNKINLNHPGIIKVIASLSKPFGLYYYRIGFCFSKTPLPTLEANKWFKNIFSCLIGQRVLQNLKPFQLYEKYRAYQQVAIGQLAKYLDASARASAVFFLAYQPLNSQPVPEQLVAYSRGTNLRFCLSPYFMNRSDWVEASETFDPISIEAYEERKNF